VGNQILDKVTAKTQNQVINVIEELHEQWKDWFTLSNPQLVEDYVKGKAHFLVVIEDLAKPSNQFVAFIERALPVVRNNAEVENLTQVNIRGHVNSFFFKDVSGHPAPDPPRGIEAGDLGTDCYQEAVLIDVVKLAQFP